MVRDPSSANGMTPSRRPDRSPRAAARQATTREQFVAAARTVIETHGFQGFSLERVAQHTGLRKQAVYHYFRSKEAVLFEVAFVELSSVAQAVARAVDATSRGDDAVEALLRTYFAAFQGRNRLFQLSHTVLPQFDAGPVLREGGLDRIRPLNDLLLAGVAHRVARDRGRPAGDPEARRFAFTAYTAVIGLLTLKALVESVDDPLRHSDTALIDTLVTSFRHAVNPPEAPP